jgi:ribosome-associated translation inhibitor RaiA
VIRIVDHTPSEVDHAISRLGQEYRYRQALRARVNARIAEVTAKYFDGGFSGHVTIGKEGFGFAHDCVVHLDPGIVLEADALAADAYASAGEAALRLEKRLRRYGTG